MQTRLPARLSSCGPTAIRRNWRPHARAFANNYGNQGSGREQLGGSLTWFSPTGASDSLTALVVGTADSTYGSLRYARPVNRHNGVAYVEAWALVEKRL